MSTGTKPSDTELGEDAPKSGTTTQRNLAGFPKRYVIVIMLFLGLATQYALRVNINIAITAMTNNHTVKQNGFTITRVRRDNVIWINKNNCIKMYKKDLFWKK